MSQRYQAGTPATSSSTMDPSNAAVVFIPSACAGPALYEKVVSVCRIMGYEAHVIQNPSSRGPGGRPPSLYDDAANARRHVESLVRQGKQVLLVGHSYGAIVAAECCEGLGVDDMLGESTGGGVIRLLFVAGIVPEAGQSATEALAGRLGIQPDGIEHGFIHHNPDKMARYFYSSLPLDEAAQFVELNTRQSAQSLSDPLTYPGYRYIPVTYLVTDRDVLVPPHLQERFIRVIQRSGQRQVDVLHYPVDHCPNVTKPEALLDCIRRAAGEETLVDCNWI